MKPLFVFIVLLFFSNLIVAQKKNEPMPYGLTPTERQVLWHETEFYAIVHFTPTTFENKEWGYGDADPKVFNPSAFDANQIVAAAKSAGIKGIVFVCKHHDGFCLWPTKTTGYNISKSPWKSGNGDMVREFRNACDKAGLKFGAYISPWDRNSPDYGTPKYLETYRNQLREIYSNYGRLFMSWHDGANGGDGYYGGARETRQIDRTNYYDWNNTWAITRKLQPEACIFSDIGWDVRWVGNEEGFGGETCWATFTPKGREIEDQPGNGNSRYWEATEGHHGGKYWLPAECDVPLRPGWFYHPEQDSHVKTPTELFDLYCKSVGRGQCLDLGLAPDKRGLLHENDVAALKGLGELIAKTFSGNLAKEGKITLSNIRGNDKSAYGVQKLLDNDRYSYWATDDAVTTPELVLEFKTSQIFNIVRIRENIKLGQRIDKVGIDTWKDGSWHELAKATSIGALRIIRLPFFETTTKIRMRIVGAAASPCISEFGVYAEPTALPSPQITRSVDGNVTISTETAVQTIRYTTDGSEPTLSSPAFNHAFALPKGGVVKTCSFDLAGNKSETTVEDFDLCKKGWKLHSCSFEAKNGEGEKAFDDNRNTALTISGEMPQEITIDMGTIETVRSLSYLPTQNGKTDGLAEQYRISVSEDGEIWKIVAEGEFANIRANTVKQIISLSTSVKARYFKFSILRSIGNNVSVAELGVKI